MSGVCVRHAGSAAATVSADVLACSRVLLVQFIRFTNSLNERGETFRGSRRAIRRQSCSKKLVTAASPASCSFMGVAMRGKVFPKGPMHHAERLGPTLRRWPKIAVGVTHSNVSGPTTYLAAACEPGRFVQKEPHILTPCVL